MLPRPLPDPDLVPLPDVPRRPDGRVDLDAIQAGLGDRAHLLETVPGTPHAGRWSYVTARTAGHLSDDGASVLFEAADGAPTALGHDAFAALDRLCEGLGLSPHTPVSTDLPPFTGGLVGVFGYDLARGIEQLPTFADADRVVPDLALDVVTAAIAVDHATEEAHVVHRGPCDVAAIAAELRDACPARPSEVTPRRVTTSLAPAAYRDAVAAVLEHIAAGDTFQVNLSQRLTSRWDDDVTALYRALRDASNAAFGACLQWPDRPSLASISPETFLHTEGAHVVTRPIKGTRPRSEDAAVDAATATTLTTSEKDRAENVMVVDMERNDLGRVCVPGSVRVPSLLELEGHPTVWHLVSTVEGTLRPDVGYAELLRATFPCGSVTGTPKVAAMRLIDTYEPVRRGWYCGAIGFLSPGAMSTSVAIRTAIQFPDGRVDYAAGGGIVADSDPTAEHRESLDKAQAFLRAVGGRLPDDDPADLGDDAGDELAAPARR